MSGCPPQLPCSWGGGVLVDKTFDRLHTKRQKKKKKKKKINRQNDACVYPPWHQFAKILTAKNLFARVLAAGISRCAVAMSGGRHLELVRPKRGGPLFVFQDCRFLTRQRLVYHRRAALQCAGISPNQYSGHSCHIGAASTAARAGIENSTTIKMLGRWESAGFLR